MELLNRFFGVGEPRIQWDGVTYEPERLRGLAGAVAARLAELPQGARVGLHLGHGVSAPLWLLGCWQAGKVAVPLDLHLPPARLRALLERSGAELVVSEGRRGELLTRELGVPRVLGLEGLSLGAGPLAGQEGNVEGSPGPVWERDGAEPALILWTSGSTGAPKGVTIPRRAIDAFVAHWRERLGVGPGDRIAWTAALSFDLSLLDLGVALSSGATLVPIPEGLLGLPRDLARWLHEQQITGLYAVPSLLAGLVEGGLPPSLRWVLSAGEALSPALAMALRARVPRVLNLFGPTETNVSTAWEVPPGPLDAVPIGAPCPYGEVRLEAGELLVRGATVMLGYWGEPERASWVEDPDGAWLRTGDRARWEGESLRFLGRADRMLKVRGYRVEPEEVERALRDQPGVRDAAVHHRDGVLRAWVEAEDGAAGGEQTGPWLAALRRSLPAQAVPERITVLPALPRTPRGKVDRAALG